MKANDDTYSALERALCELFPQREVQIQPNEVRGHAPAAEVLVPLQGESLRLWIEVLEDVTSARLADGMELLKASRHAHADAIPMLAAKYLSPIMQQQLRNDELAFLDYAGNAWLAAPGVHIDRRGFLNPAPERRGHRDLFSDKASLIARVLLAADSPLGIRQIADLVSSHDEQHIKLTPGYVSKVVKELERQGYAARQPNGIVLRHATEFLGDWLAACRSRRRSVGHSYFIHATSALSAMPTVAAALDDGGIDYVFTGHAGASLVDPYTEFDVAEVYVRDLDKAASALNAVGARRVERGANLIVSLPYYKVSAFYDAQVSSGFKCASDIQLYLDLYDYPIRGREQAEHLYEQRLQPVIERNGVV